MDKDPLLYIHHIEDAISSIEEYVTGINESDFLEKKLVQDAVIRNLEIIGEAAKRLPDGIKLSYARIEWKKICGMRDVLIHDYLGVDIKKVWNVVINHLPELKKEISFILQAEK